MKYIVLFIFCGLSTSLTSQLSEFIYVDQFGYLRDSDKVAVISDPEEGFNGEQSYNPENVFEVRSVENNEVVFSNEITPWKAGELHAQSGNRGWWFYFGGVTQSGPYYVHDPSSGESSARFEVVTIDKSIKVYPESSTDHVVIDGNIMGHKLVVLNNVGVEVLSHRVNNKVYKLDLQDLVPGVYYLQLTNTENQIVALEKVIKL